MIGHMFKYHLEDIIEDSKGHLLTPITPYRYLARVQPEKSSSTKHVALPCVLSSVFHR